MNKENISSENKNGRQHLNGPKYFHLKSKINGDNATCQDNFYVLDEWINILLLIALAWIILNLQFWSLQIK